MVALPDFVLTLEGYFAIGKESGGVVVSVSGKAFDIDGVVELVDAVEVGTGDVVVVWPFHSVIINDGWR